MIRRPPRSTQSRSSAASDVYKRQVTQSRSYWIYRPDNLSRTNSVPMILYMEAGGDAPMTFAHRLADQAGFVLVSCTFQGNSFGTVWNSDNPRISGFEDMDYA